MKDPQKRRKFSIIDLILIILLIIMGVALYRVTGGDLSRLSRLGELGSGSGGPLSGITESLSAFGEGLKNTFAGFLR